MIRTDDEIPYNVVEHKKCPRCSSTNLKFKDILFMKYLKKFFKMYDCKECDHRFVILSSIKLEEEI